MTVVDTPAVRPRGRKATEILAAEQLAELRAMRQTMTDLAARTSGRMVNATPHVATYTFPTTTDGSTPSVTVSLGVALGAVRVTNPSAAGVVTFVPSGPREYASGGGIGVALILPGSRDTIACDTHTFTLYGTAADRVSVQCFAAGVTPSS